MVDSVEEWGEIQQNYYRLEPSTRGDRLVEGLDYLANRFQFPDQHTHDIHVYLFAKAGQLEQEIVGKYKVLLDRSSEQGRLFISTILGSLGEETQEHGVEELEEIFPAGLDASVCPIQTGFDLDYVWVDFFLTGRQEPVLRVIEVIAWPDRIRIKLETWLRTPEYGLLARWVRKLAAKRIDAATGIVFDPQSECIRTDGDLDARCSVDEEEDIIEGYLPAIRKVFPFPISDADVSYVATKGVARWSVASMVRKDATVARIYEEALPSLRRGTELRLP